MRGCIRLISSFALCRHDGEPLEPVAAAVFAGVPQAREGERPRIRQLEDIRLFRWLALFGVDPKDLLIPFVGTNPVRSEKVCSRCALLSFWQPGNPLGLINLRHQGHSLC